MNCFALIFLRTATDVVNAKLEEDKSKTHGKLVLLTKVDDRSRRVVRESDLMEMQQRYNQKTLTQRNIHTDTDISNSATNTSNSTHIQREEDEGGKLRTRGSDSVSRPSTDYFPGQMVCAKIANIAAENEPFYARPGVSSLLNTLSAMCLAHHHSITTHSVNHS